MKKIDLFIKQHFNDPESTTDYLINEIRTLNKFFKNLIKNGFTLVKIGNQYGRNIIENNDRFQALGFMAEYDDFEVTITDPNGKKIILAMLLGQGEFLPIYNSYYPNQEDLETIDPIIKKHFAQAVKKYSFQFYNTHWIQYA